MAGQFATLVVGRAAHDGSIELVSAGHLPLLHLCAGETKSRGATGVPLGMFPTTNFPIFSFSVQAGDSLLIYTDGLSEARNAAGEEYGLNRVRSVADGHRTKAPAELISNCLADLDTFTAGTKPADDLTMLALQRAD